VSCNLKYQIVHIEKSLHVPPNQGWPTLKLLLPDVRFSLGFRLRRRWESLITALHQTS